MHAMAQYAFFGDPHFAQAPAAKLTNSGATEFICDWMTQELPCLAGRREFLKGRYMIEIATKQTVPDIYHRYCNRLEQSKAIACLYLFNDKEMMGVQKSVSEVFYYLAEQMQNISDVDTDSLANGASLTKKIRLRCPVTGIMSEYDDFECVAFCPQSNNPDDPLYDPLMAMPLPAVNMSSDMFAFSNFVADMVKQRYQMSVSELSKDRSETEKALSHCVTQWHRIASKIIENYQSLTDTSLCPVHINKQGDQWIAAHKDPAFAEQIKEVHSHELPVLYGKRIVKEWLDHFYNDHTFSASGLARDGVMLS